MYENFSIYVVNDEILNCISDIIFKLGKLEIFSCDIKNETSKIDPFDRQEFLKIDQIRDIEIDSKFNFKYPKAQLINPLIDNLFKWLNNAKNKTHPLIYIPIFLYGLLFIQPFNDYENIKKWVRLLLANYNNFFANITFPKNIFNCQKFYVAINNSYQGNDINDFIIYFLNIINESLDKYMIKEKIVIDFDKVKTTKLLNVMEKNKPMTAYEIMEKLNIKSKETLRNTYLNDAIKRGIVFLTIPNKPTSRHQMYYKI